MPATTEALDYGSSGQHLYAAIRSRTSGQWWNGSAMAAYADANWATYAVAMPEIGTSGVYVLTVPGALPADDYDFMVSVRAGATAALGDAPASSLSEHWSGTALSPVGAAGGLSAFQVGSLRFLRNRWTLSAGSGGERLRVYAEDGTTGDYSGIVTRDANQAVNSFTPDPAFVP